MTEPNNNLAPIEVVAIDDHHLIRQGIRSLLAKSEAVTLVDEGWVGDHLMMLVERHVPDIVLLDLEMSQAETTDRGSKRPFRAFPAVAQLSETYPEVRVIIISQHTSPALVEGAMKAGVCGYLLKDDALSLHLIEAIRTVHMGGFYLSGEVSEQLVNLKLDSPTPQLTKRQLEIIQVVATFPNRSYTQHAQALGISENTFSNHLRHIFEKLEVTNVTAAVVKGIQLGVVSLPPLEMR